MRIINPIMYLFFALLLPSTTTTASPVLDLSYKHFLEPQILEEAIRASIDQQPEQLVVDISSSLLDNEKGFEGILQTLLPKDGETNQGSAVRLTFLSRHNRITPGSLDKMFQMLLSSTTNTTDDNQGDENGKNETASEELAAVPSEVPSRPWSLKHLDVGWNALHPDAAGWKNFLKSLQKLLQTPEVCPEIIRFERCGLSPAACRAMGKGIIKRYGSSKGSTAQALSLHLCGNPDLGDAGSAAIAAAIRTVVTDGENDEGSIIVLDTLDLSACGIGDAGAEALALALESSPQMCIRHLDLSNNDISDVGAAAIGHALLSNGAERNGMPVLESLDLSGNKDIKDEAATAIAEAVGKGLVSVVSMRSCHILADGATAFGRAVVSLAKRTPGLNKVKIDLSGNPLGVLRGKTKQGGKYSASAIKSKATATTAAYMSMFQKGLKKGLKEYGVDLGGNSGESDDEEEARSGMGDDLVGDEDLDPSKARCGVKAFSNAILDESGNGKVGSATLRCELGLRRCFLDHGAADALAAVVLHAREDLSMDLAFDLALNPVLEEEMIEAIQGDERQDDLLRDMSEKYLDALEALREARERAVEAARAAAARMQAEKELESQWDLPSGFGDDWGEQDYDDEWDSDADYEEEDEYY